MRFLRRALCSIALLTAATLSASAQTNYTTTMTLNTLRGTGGAVASAKVCAVAVDAYGNPLAFSAPTWGLVQPGTQFCGTVSSGTISGGFTLPDACHTNQPTPIFYNVTIQQLSVGVPVGSAVALNGPPIPNVCGTTYPLDSYTPSTTVISPTSQIVATGTSVPSSCTSPSILLATVSTVTTGYVCSGGVYVAFGQAGAVTIAGDIGGTVSSPKVAGLQGVPLSSTPPLVGQIPTYNGSAYVPATPTIAGSLASSPNVYSANSQVQVDSVASSVFYGLDCFGDSYMAGNGGFFTTGQCSIVASDYNMPTPNNYAVTGDNSGDFAWHVLSALNPSDTGNPMVIAATSQNNTNCGASSQCLQNFNQNYYAAFAWGALSSTKKILFNGNYGVAKTGTYAADTTFANANGVNCTAGPCTYTSHIIVGQPGYVYLWYIMRSTGGAITVSIDGTTATDTVTGLTSISTAWYYTPTAQTTTVGLARFAASAASPGTHTVVVTAASGAVVIGLGLPTVSRYRGVAAPRMVMGGTHQKPGATGSITIAYNNASIAVQQTLTADGLDIPFADLYNAYNLNLDFIYNWYTVSQSGSTLTVSAVNAGNTSTVQIGQQFYVAGVSIGTVTAFGTGSGGVGTYTMSTSATIASTTAGQAVQGCLPATALGHPNDCGHTNAAHAWEANLNAAPIPIQGTPAGATTVSGPVYADGPAAIGQLSLGTHFRPHSYGDTLVTGVDVAPQNSGTYYGLKFLLNDPISASAALIMYLTDSAKEVGACWANTANPTSDSAFTNCPWHVDSSGNLYAGGNATFAGTGTHTFGGTLKATALQSNSGICLYAYTTHCITPTAGNTDTFSSNGVYAPSFMGTGTPLTVASGQVAYGGTTASASNCNQGGTLTSVAGCVVINVAGTNHYYPYF